jgi:tRNA (guanine37-N1)-methyltransferase
MKISIITLFPNIFETVLNTSILKRAQNKGLIEYEVIDLRPFGEGVHQVVDDKPFGGGVGLVFKADILAKALKVAQGAVGGARSTEHGDKNPNHQPPSPALVILTSASGQTFNQGMAKELLKTDHLIIICGHYEGVDQRFIDKYVDLEISIGDYVLTGGELPALVITDAVTRLVKGVLEKEEATQKESFENNLLEHPHYTRPQDFEGMKVPEVLISGNHEAVDKWRQEQAVEKTKKLRPDLLKE